MKKQSRLNATLAAATICAALSVGTTALAQQASTDPPQQTQQQQKPQTQQQEAQEQQQVRQQEQQQPTAQTADSNQPGLISKCSQMIGAKVENQNGQKLGKISDVVVSFDKQRVSYCVMKVSTGLFTKPKLLAVPLNAFHPSDDGKYLVLNASKDNIAQAAGFNRSQWPSTINSAWGAEPGTAQQLPPEVVFAPAAAPAVLAPPAVPPPSYPFNVDPAFDQHYASPPTAAQLSDQLYFQVHFGPIATPH